MSPIKWHTASYNRGISSSALWQTYEYSVTIRCMRYSMQGARVKCVPRLSTSGFSPSCERMRCITPQLHVWAFAAGTMKKWLSSLPRSDCYPRPVDEYLRRGFTGLLFISVGPSDYDTVMQPLVGSIPHQEMSIASHTPRSN